MKKAPGTGGAGVVVRRKAGDATGVTVVTEPKPEEFAAFVLLNSHNKQKI